MSSLIETRMDGSWYSALEQSSVVKLVDCDGCVGVRPIPVTYNEPEVATPTARLSPIPVGRGVRLD